jgi:hypothetical protein
MAVFTVGSHRLTGGVDTDSDTVLAVRLDAVLQTLENLHVGSVEPYTGGDPEHSIHFTDPVNGIDVRITLQVRDRGISVSVPAQNRVCLTWLEGVGVYLDRYNEFISAATPPPITEAIVVRTEELYGDTRYLFTYQSSDPGALHRTMNFRAPYAAHIARFLDSLLGTAVEQALVENNII